MTSRRQFIGDCSAFALAATMIPAATMADRRAVLGFTAFAALVNSPFMARMSDGPAQALDLIGVDGDAGAFSLFFSGEVTRPFHQNTYWFEHPRLGRFEMFIVPVGRSDGNHCYYEAVFDLKSYG